MRKRLCLCEISHSASWCWDAGDGLEELGSLGMEGPGSPWGGSRGRRTAVARVFLLSSSDAELKFRFGLKDNMPIKMQISWRPPKAWLFDTSFQVWNVQAPKSEVLGNSEVLMGESHQSGIFWRSHGISAWISQQEERVILCSSSQKWSVASTFLLQLSQQTVVQSF